MIEAATHVHHDLSYPPLSQPESSDRTLQTHSSGPLAVDYCTATPTFTDWTRQEADTRSGRTTTAFHCWVQPELFETLISVLAGLLFRKMLHNKPPPISNTQQ